MKKIIGIILVICIIMVCISGCKTAENPKDEVETDSIETISNDTDDKQEKLGGSVETDDKLSIVYAGTTFTVQAGNLASPSREALNRMNHHVDANFDGYKVQILDNTIYVELNSRDNWGDQIIHKVEDGYFEGMNRGEFGGYLKFYNDFNEYQILNTNVNFMVEINDQIYVLSGLAHLGLDTGYMYRIEKEEDVWTAKKILDIGSAPYVILADESRLYIVASSKVIMIENEEIKEVMVENAFWEGLYPNSVVIYDNKLLIGMRGCICTVDISTNELKWYSLTLK